MKSFDYDTAKAVINLKDNVNFETFIKYAKTCVDTAEKQACVEKDEVMLRWLQGRLQAMGHIIDEINKANETIKKINDFKKFERNDLNG